MKMKTIKKNQVMIAVIAVMLMAAGYFNYNETLKGKEAIETGKLMDAEELASIGDATLVSSEALEEENLNTIATNSTNEITQNKEEGAIEKVATQQEEVQTTNAEVKPDEYFSKSRLERDNMYSQSLETYEKLLANNSISADQKQIAQTEVKRIQDEKNAIMIAENLIKTKGFEDVIIFMNKDSVNIIVKCADLTDEGIAQVQNIITRELKVEIENMHISSK